MFEALKNTMRDALMQQSTDPRPLWLARINATLDRECYGLTQQQADEICGSLLAKLQSQLCDYLASGEVHKAMYAIQVFGDRLRQQIEVVRSRGDLTVKNTVDANARKLQGFCWRGPEQTQLKLMLIGGEQITAVSWDFITTDQRRIARSDVRMLGKPAYWTRDANWLSQFTSDNAVADARATAKP